MSDLFHILLFAMQTALTVRELNQWGKDMAKEISKLPKDEIEHLRQAFLDKQQNLSTTENSKGKDNGIRAAR